MAMTADLFWRSKHTWHMFFIPRVRIRGELFLVSIAAASVTFDTINT
jgi:hypothetical protein